MINYIKEVVDELVGIPYEHNGRSKNGIDCWGLVYLFFNKLGIKLPRNDGKYISQDWYKIEPDRYIKGLEELGGEVGHYKNLKLFDVPYFRLYRNVITHSGVMIDNKHFIHVLINDRVSIATMKRRIWRGKYAGAKRIDFSQWPGGKEFKSKF